MQVTCVEVEELRVLHHERNRWNGITDIFILTFAQSVICRYRATAMCTYAWIVCDSTGQIKVSFVLLVEHGSTDVRHVASRVAFTSHEDFEILDTKHSLPVLEKTNEVLSNLFFCCCSHGSR